MANSDADRQQCADEFRAGCTSRCREESFSFLSLQGGHHRLHCGLETDTVAAAISGDRVLKRPRPRLVLWDVADERLDPQGISEGEVWLARRLGGGLLLHVAEQAAPSGV